MAVPHNFLKILGFGSWKFTTLPSFLLRSKDFFVEILVDFAPFLKDHEIGSSSNVFINFLLRMWHGSGDHVCLHRPWLHLRRFLRKWFHTGSASNPRRNPTAVSSARRRPECGRNMGVSKNNGTPKSSILIGFSIINHPFWGTTIFGNTHMVLNDDFFLKEWPDRCHFVD